MKFFGKILVANRGEIAVRILKTLDKLGIASLVVYSSDDRDSLAVKLADEACLLEGDTLQDTYLNISLIISIARSKNVDAIHPGYGFLSENPEFALACEHEGIVFIGPRAETIKLLGDKVSAREFARKLDIPVVKSIYGTAEQLCNKAGKHLKFPVVIKPSGGGGGKGMRVVENTENLREEISACSREAENYFGNPEVYIEEYISDARHIEVQILGDGNGNSIHLYDRECSIQRRFQKIIEEAPSPGLTEVLREKITSLACRVSSEARYRNAGTVEFLFDKNMNFYFLEMNTRIQVEHPVTECVTGIDLIEEQIWIARNNNLKVKQEDIRLKGHAIELRIYAEDPLKDFLPSTGEILYYREPVATEIRIDKGFDKTAFISPSFDPLIAKLICFSQDRKQAINRLVELLPEYIILGISNNLDYILQILKHPTFRNGEYFTQFISKFSEIFQASQNGKLQSISPEVMAVIYSYAVTNSHSEMRLSPGLKDPWKETTNWRSVPFTGFSVNEKNYLFVTDISESAITIWSETGKKVFFIRAWENMLEISRPGKKLCSWWVKGSKGEIQAEIEGIKLIFYPVIQKLTKKEGLNIKNTESEIIHSPMHGKIINLKVSELKKVKKGEVLLILESMKMENNICATQDGVVQNFFVKNGEQVEKNAPLLSLSPGVASGPVF